MTSMAQEAEETKGSEAWSAAPVIISTSQPGGECIARQRNALQLWTFVYAYSRLSGVNGGIYSGAVVWNGDKMIIEKNACIFFASVHVLLFKKMMLPTWQQPKSTVTASSATSVHQVLKQLLENKFYVRAKAKQSIFYVL